jgi:hypothetical protein
MMTKFTAVLTTLFLAMSSINADKVRGLRSGPPGAEGPRGTRRLMHGMHDKSGKNGHDHGHGSHKGRGFGGPKDDYGGKCAHVDESALVDLSCPAFVANEPDCAFGDGELGTWLCRTMFDRFTGESDSYSTCGNATRALLLDDCGCCEGACPVECESVCSLNGVAGAGVNVTETGPSGEEHYACLAPERAISLIATRDGRFQCVTE